MIPVLPSRPLDQGVHNDAERARLYIEAAQSEVLNAREWLAIERARIETLILQLNTVLDKEARGMRNPVLQQTTIEVRLAVLEIQGLQSAVLGSCDSARGLLAAAWSSGEQATQAAAAERGLLVWLLRHLTPWHLNERRETR